MTQQPFYPQQFPQQPYPVDSGPQGYPPQQGYAQPGYPPQQGYPPAFPQQGYAPQVAPQAPAQPLANGSLDDFYAQPSSSSGPGIKWTNPDGSQKPIGTSYTGTVARDVTHGDVQQITNPQGVPQFYRDGRPKFQMKVPLKLQHPEFPDGEATFYVKGQAKDELTRAMTALGLDGSPKGGDVIRVTLVQRRPNPGMQPTNVVQIDYHRPDGGQSAQGQPAQQVQQPVPTEAPSPVAVAQPQVQQPQIQPGQPQVNPYAQGGQVVQQAPGQQFPQQPQGGQVVQQPVQGQQPQQPTFPPAQQPQQQAPGQIALPDTLNPGQQALFAQLAGTQQAQG